MQSVRVAALAIALLLLCAHPIAAGEKTVTEGGDAGLRLYRNLPKDPVLAVAVSVDDLAQKLDGFMEMLGKYAPEGAESGLAQGLVRLETKLGFTVNDGILAHIGPEITLALDLPPIDQALVAFQDAGGNPLGTLIGKSGLLAEVRNGEELDRALRLLADRLGGEASAERGLVRVVVPMSFGNLQPSGAAPGSTGLTAYYAVRGGRLALGFSREWVEASLGDRPRDERLESGTDYRTVFSHLDGRPTSLIYVNLPKIRELIDRSQIVKAVLGSNPESAALLESILTTGVMGVGLGSTSVAVDGGVKTTNFGPSWMSGAAMSGGLLAAMAVPNMLSAADQGKANRTLGHIRSIAVACEGFSRDADGYPGPTDGWVPVEKIATFLEPMYISKLPRRDGWHNPILYWSDGSSYRILSTGKDGQIDQDWTGVDDPVTASAKLEGDIVYGDGRLLVVPSRLSAE